MVAMARWRADADEGGKWQGGNAMQVPLVENQTPGAFRVGSGSGSLRSTSRSQCDLPVDLLYLEDLQIALSTLTIDANNLKTITYSLGIPVLHG